VSHPRGHRGSHHLPVGAKKMVKIETNLFYIYFLDTSIHYGFFSTNFCTVFFFFHAYFLGCTLFFILTSFLCVHVVVYHGSNFHIVIFKQCNFFLFHSYLSLS